MPFEKIEEKKENIAIVVKDGPNAEVFIEILNEEDSSSEWLCRLGIIFNAKQQLWVYLTRKEMADIGLALATRSTDAYKLTAN